MVEFPSSACKRHTNVLHDSCLHSLGFFQVTVAVPVFGKPPQLLKSTSEGAVCLDQAHNSPLLNRDDLVLGLNLFLSIH